MTDAKSTTLPAAPVEGPGRNHRDQVCDHGVRGAVAAVTCALGTRISTNLYDNLLSLIGG